MAATREAAINDTEAFTDWHWQYSRGGGEKTPEILHATGWLGEHHYGRLHSPSRRCCIKQAKPIYTRSGCMSTIPIASNATSHAISSHHLPHDVFQSVRQLELGQLRGPPPQIRHSFGQRHAVISANHNRGLGLGVGLGQGLFRVNIG